MSISYSPSTRSSSAWSRTSPRTIIDALEQPRRATNSLCGTQSRTRQTTSAPASSRRRTSQPPTRPVAPVTNVGRSRQNVGSFPHLPRRVSCSATALPAAACRAACPCTARSRRAGRRPAAARAASRSSASRLEAARRRRRGSRRSPARSTKKPPLIQPSPICGFSVNSATRSPSKIEPAEARRRAHGRDGRELAVRPVERAAARAGRRRRRRRRRSA